MEEIRGETSIMYRPTCDCKSPFPSNSNLWLCFHCGGELYPTNAPKKEQQVAKQLEVNIVTEKNFESESESTKMNTKKAATDKVRTGLVLIPFYSLLALGKIFIEGLRYGRDNWKKGVHDKEYQEERLEHAILHLIKWKEGDRSEAHLAKVAWFCFTQLEIERLEDIRQDNIGNICEISPEKECPEIGTPGKYQNSEAEIRSKQFYEGWEKIYRKRCKIYRKRCK